MRDRIVALIVGRKGSKGLAEKNIINIFFIEIHLPPFDPPSGMYK